MLDFPCCGVCEGLRPKCTAAGEGAPFAGDGVLGDVGFDDVVVEDFESGNVAR